MGHSYEQGGKLKQGLQDVAMDIQHFNAPKLAEPCLQTKLSKQSAQACASFTNLRQDYATLAAVHLQP